MLNIRFKSVILFSGIFCLSCSSNNGELWEDIDMSRYSPIRLNLQRLELNQFQLDSDIKYIEAFEIDGDYSSIVSEVIKYSAEMTLYSDGTSMPSGELRYCPGTMTIPYHSGGLFECGKLLKGEKSVTESTNARLELSGGKNSCVADTVIECTINMQSILYSSKYGSACTSGSELCRYSYQINRQFNSGYIVSMPGGSVQAAMLMEIGDRIQNVDLNTFALYFGEIDTVDEALVIAKIHGYSWNSGRLDMGGIRKLENDRYEMLLFKSSRCPYKLERVLVHVSKSGEVFELRSTVVKETDNCIVL